MEIKKLFNNKITHLVLAVGLGLLAVKGIDNIEYKKSPARPYLDGRLEEHMHGLDSLLKLDGILTSEQAKDYLSEQGLSEEKVDSALKWYFYSKSLPYEVSSSTAPVPMPARPPPTIY